MAFNGKNDLLLHLKLFLSKDDADGAINITPEYFPAIIYVVNKNDNLIDIVNEERVCEALGYSAEDIKSWERSLKNLVFKEDWEKVEEALGKCERLLEDEDLTYPVRLNHKNENWRYFRTRGTVLKRESNGTPLSYIFVAEDVTEKMLYEEETAALSHLVTDTEELLNFGSWTLDLEDDELKWSDGMYSLMGYEKSVFTGKLTNKFFFSHFSEADAQNLQASMAAAVATNSGFEYECAIITGTGEEKVVSTKGKAVLVPGKGVIKMFGMTRDITEQKRLTRDLERHKEMVLEKEEFLNQGSWETDLTTGRSTWSEGMFRLFGHASGKEEPVPQTLHFEHMSPHSLAGRSSHWNPALIEGGSYTRESTVETLDGRARQLETYGKVIRNGKGVAEKIFGTTRDVTTLRENEKNLQAKVQELNRSNLELEEFAYVASHDLQEPLRKLTTFCERLQTKYSPVLGSDGLLYLDRITAAAENMRSLIDNLLEFSRTARLSKHFFEADLNKILEEVKAHLELKIEETGSVITNTELPVFEVIPSQIAQLFDNIINNSIKFRKPQQVVHIHITSQQLTGADKIKYNLKIDQDYQKLTISDDGIGFEMEYAERIFQIFQRLHGKAEYPGSGIGLAICKKIVDNHNGIIFAQAHPGQGAVFTIILPEIQST